MSLATASCDLWQNEQRSDSSEPREVFIGRTAPEKAVQDAPQLKFTPVLPRNYHPSRLPTYIQMVTQKKSPGCGPGYFRYTGALYVRGRSMMSSMIPYSLACGAVMIKSRSTSRSMRSSVW